MSSGQPFFQLNNLMPEGENVDLFTCTYDINRVWIALSFRTERIQIIHVFLHPLHCLCLIWYWFPNKHPKYKCRNNLVYFESLFDCYFSLTMWRSFRPDSFSFLPLDSLRVCASNELFCEQFNTTNVHGHGSAYSPIMFLNPKFYNGLYFNLCK